MRNAVVLHIGIDDEMFRDGIHLVLCGSDLYPQQACKILRGQSFSWSVRGWGGVPTMLTAEMCVDTVLPKYGRNIPRVKNILYNGGVKNGHHVRHFAVEDADQSMRLACCKPFPLPWGTELVCFERFEHSEHVPYKMFVASFEQCVEPFGMHGTHMRGQRSVFHLGETTCAYTQKFRCCVWYK